jgi:hypothetical protein
MKTTMELPDDLMKQIKLRAVHEEQKLKDMIAELLRKGLAAGKKAAGNVKASKEVLDRRRQMTRKFVSGEWGVELAGFEEARKADRRKARERASAWRD